jgi:signal transduction histidine kinase
VGPSAYQFHLPTVPAHRRRVSAAMSKLRCYAALVTAIVLALLMGVPLSAQNIRPRILVIVESDSRLPHVQDMLRGMESALGPMATRDGEYFIEYLDMLRFGSLEETAILRDFLVARYGHANLDAVAVIGPNALEFVVDHRESIAGDAPIVFGGLGSEGLAGLTDIDVGPDLSGVLSDYDLLATLDLARTVQDDATSILVVVGSAPFDRQWRETARAAIGDEYRGLPVRYVEETTAEALLDQAASLDPRTIVLLLTLVVDTAGNRFIPRQFADLYAPASAAPVWSVYPTYFGSGVIGGRVEDLERTGQAMAALIADAVAKSPLPPVQTVASRSMVDWRALELHGLDTADLPPDTTILFYEPSLWERYRVPIAVTLAIIAAQALTIAALVINRRRLIGSQASLASERAQLVHVSRNLRLGQLSAALAHEINQPLAAIQANADAGSRLVTRTPPDTTEVAQIFDDITSDVARASAIIANLRRLIVKGETTVESLDLNDIVGATLSLAANELAARGAQVRTDLAPGRLDIRGNGPQLQQIVLNLAFNAAEAMADLPERDRIVRVTTAQTPDGNRTLTVADAGPGVEPDLREDLFRPFVTSKATGLGVGLSICRNIAEAHGGTLGFTNAARGANIRLTLPPPTAAT